MRYARAKFAIGDRVKLSGEGLMRLRGMVHHDKTTRGTIAGYCRSKFSVQVLRDDLAPILGQHP